MFGEGLNLIQLVLEVVKWWDRLAEQHNFRFHNNGGEFLEELIRYQ
jgi:hypothetical protein